MPPCRSRSWLSVLPLACVVLLSTPLPAAEEDAAPPPAKPETAVAPSTPDQTPEPPAGAPEPGSTTAIDSTIFQLSDRILKAYESRKTFEVTIDTKSGGETPIEFQTLLQWEKPNRLSIRTRNGKNEFRVVSDGKHLYATGSKNPMKYFRMKAPGDFSDLMQEALNMVEGIGLGPMDLILTGRDPFPSPSITVSARRLEATPIDGVKVDGITFLLKNPKDETKPYAVRIFVGETDHLLRRVELESPETGGVLVERHSGIKPAPALPPKTFTFAPPKGAEAIEIADEPALHDPALKVGAKPFPIAVKDTSNEPLSLELYKGKVVLIDFWASWCVPCIMSLPDLVSVYDKLHPKGFEIVGISLDRADGRSSMQGLIDKFGMKWRNYYDGKTWDNAVAKRYGVQGIPVSFLIGKDGTIAAVNPKPERLERLVEAELAK